MTHPLQAALALKAQKVIPDLAADKLMMLLSSSCNCMTKSPEIEHHHERCPYRLVTEVIELISAGAPSTAEVISEPVDPSTDPVLQLLAGCKATNPLVGYPPSTFIDMMLSLLDSSDYDYLDNSSDEFKALHEHYGDRLMIRTVVNISHDSDEECALDVLMVDGVPSMLGKRVGDHNSYRDGIEVLNGPKAAAILRVMMSVSGRDKVKQTEETKPVALTLEMLFKNMQYISRIGESMFCLNSAKWSFGFCNLTQEYDAYCFDDQGVIRQIDSIGDWVTKAPSWEDKESKVNVMLRATDVGAEPVAFVAKANDVFFGYKHLDHQKDLEAIHQDLHRESFWMIKKERDNINFYQHIKGEFDCNTKCLFIQDQNLVDKMFDILLADKPSDIDPGDYEIMGVLDLQKLIEDPRFSFLKDVRHEIY